MTEHDDLTPRRSGETAPSSPAASPLGTPKIPLGDIDDLQAFSRKIARHLAGDEDELEDLIAEAISLAFQKFKALPEGESLKQALTCWLESRLRDYRRKNHPERRRNCRAGTTYTLPSPTGLAWEHAATTAAMPVSNEAAVIQSRLAHEIFKRREDLYDPRLVGRFHGVPSWGAIATGRSAEIWATIEAERATTTRKPFRFVKPHDIE